LKQLEKKDPMKSELIEMSYFGGFTAEEISRAVSKPFTLCAVNCVLRRPGFAWRCPATCPTG